MSAKHASFLKMESEGLQSTTGRNTYASEIEGKVTSAGAAAQALDVFPYFAALTSSETFKNEYWQKKPFLHSTPLPNMDQQFTFSDVAVEVEKGFLDAGRGTFVEGRSGWQMASVGKPRGTSFEEAKMRIKDVEKALAERSGTVVFNSAGAKIKPLAQVCYGTSEATRLPTALNLYLTAAGQATSAPPHTDKQDVFVLQTQGKKGWKVFSPPNPSECLKADPFARGKGTDVLDIKTLGEPLIDTVLLPGQMLYVPAGFPHTTDTIRGNEVGGDPSVHLTIGIDTHIWGLTYAHLREFAFKHTKIEDSVQLQHLDQQLYWDFQGVLPLGFMDEGAYDKHARWRDTKAFMAQNMVDGVLKLIRRGEPGRWDKLSDDELANKLELSHVANRLIDHHSKITGILNEMYLDTIHELTDVPMGLSVFRVKPYMDKLENTMEELYGEFTAGPPASIDNGMSASAGSSEERKGFGGSKQAKSAATKKKGMGKKKKN